VLEVVGAVHRLVGRTPAVRFAGEGAGGDDAGPCLEAGVDVLGRVALLQLRAVARHRLGEGAAEHRESTIRLVVVQEGSVGSREGLECRQGVFGQLFDRDHLGGGGVHLSRAGSHAAILPELRHD